MIFAAENSINSKKPGFGRKNVITLASLPLTLGPTEQATLVETDTRLILLELELESQYFLKRIRN